MAKHNNPLFKKTANTPEVVHEQTYIAPDAVDLLDSKPPASLEKPLSKNEQKRLAELESVVTNNFQAFYDVGCALREIQQQRLYRQTHPTFADYANDLWDLARRRAYQFIESADVIDNVKQIEMCTNGTQKIIPQNERQARVLSKYPPEKQVEIWSQAVQNLDGGKMTAGHIRTTANRLGLEKIKKVIKKGRQAANQSPRISEQFRTAFNGFLDAINIERAEKYKNTDQKEVIRHVHIILEALEAEL